MDRQEGLLTIALAAATDFEVRQIKGALGGGSGSGLGSNPGSSPGSNPGSSLVWTAPHLLLFQLAYPVRNFLSIGLASLVLLSSRLDLRVLSTLRCSPVRVLCPH